MIRRTMIELAASVVVIMAAPGCKKSGDGAASENKAVSAETGKAGSGDTAKAGSGSDMAAPEACQRANLSRISSFLLTFRVAKPT